MTLGSAVRGKISPKAITAGGRGAGSAAGVAGADMARVAAPEAGIIRAAAPGAGASPLGQRKEAAARTTTVASVGRNGIVTRPPVSAMAGRS